MVFVADSTSWPPLGWIEAKTELGIKLQASMMGLMFMLSSKQVFQPVNVVELS